MDACYNLFYLISFYLLFLISMHMWTFQISITIIWWDNRIANCEWSEIESVTNNYYYDAERMNSFPKKKHLQCVYSVYSTVNSKNSNQNIPFFTMHLTVKLPLMSAYSHNIYYKYILALMWFRWTWNIYCNTIELFIPYIIYFMLFLFNLCGKFIVFRRLRILKQNRRRSGSTYEFVATHLPNDMYIRSSSNLNIILN